MLKPTVGLEIHVQLNTKGKLFSHSPNTFGANPNSLVNEFDVALPGTLPVLNEKAVDLAIAFGLAVNGKINHHSSFDRKHYFYPDSPSGFQITQSFSPIIDKGEVAVKIGENVKIFKIHHTHLETDAGKSIHQNGESLVDYNRVGTPLIEIVSEPCMKSIDEAVAYAKAIYQIVCFYDICDGNLQEGSFRMDANISMSETKSLGTRCEIKNLNSFRFLKEALTYEMSRQTELLESGKPVIQQTLLFDPATGKTSAMRDKENAEDYRYFPEPDLLPLVLCEKKVEEIKAGMGQTLEQTKEILNTFDLKEEVIEHLLSEKEFLNYALSFTREDGFNKDWIKVIVFLIPEIISRNALVKSLPAKEEVLELLKAKNKGLNSLHLKTLLEKILLRESFDLQKEIVQYVNAEDALPKVINEIIANYPKEVAEYKSGKEKVMGFLIGRVMKIGKFTPEKVKELLDEKIKAL